MNQTGFNPKAWIWAIIFLVVLGLSVLVYLLFINKTPVPQTKLKNTPQVNNDTYPSSSVEERMVQKEKMKKFADYEDFADFLVDQAPPSPDFLAMRSPSILADFEPVISAESAKDISPSKVQDKNITQGSPEFSGTNIQVAGVDEADIIKTDGKYIYAISKNNLFIINAYPAKNADILAKISFKDTPQNIYIKGTRLVVYGLKHNKTPFSSPETIRMSYPAYTFVKIFDIRDKRNPKQITSFDFEGSYINSRLIGDYLYFITNTYAYNSNLPVPLPRIFQDENLLTENKKTPNCNCPDIYYVDIPYQQPNLLMVSSINISKKNVSLNNELYLTEGVQNIYVSQNNIYLTYTKYISEQEINNQILRDILFATLPLRYKEQIVTIEKSPNFVLNQREKNNKISNILQNYFRRLSNDEQKKINSKLKQLTKQKYADLSKELEKTLIYKIAINKGQLEYKSQGEVPGRVLNQFSMDEDTSGHFRIATSLSPLWQRFEKKRTEPFSNLYVLDAQMQIVGSLENFSPGEQIYSARFMQNRAYLVTFRQIDPLFVIDLSDFKNLKVLGKLKIPGYSNYLHPYDENTLIGVGKETKEDENNRVIPLGIKVALFDVSDVNNPRQKDKIILGGKGSGSLALNDHKAFLFSKDKNLLVLPMSLRENNKPDQNWGPITFRGAAVFHITADKIVLSGKIAHAQTENLSGNTDKKYGFSVYDTTVKRSLFIEDTLYTLSNRFLKMNHLPNLTVVKNLPLIKEKKDFEIIH